MQSNRSAARVPRWTMMLFGALAFSLFGSGALFAGAEGAGTADSVAAAFPRPLGSYADESALGLVDTWVHRVESEPFNLAATLIFVLAIVHTFFTAKLRHWAHALEEAHRASQALFGQNESKENRSSRELTEVSFAGQMLHFLGEVEAVFGIWAVVLLVVLVAMKGWPTARDYVGHSVNFTEATFVVVIMALASTRPILNFAERILGAVASLGRKSVAAWWATVLILAPILGSLITEPAAMTIGALLLARQFYELKPSPKFAYATLGLLFVNVSVGGTLTHFAAPPVLMVAGPWNWSLAFMFLHFGWRAVVGIVLSTTLYFVVFRKELAALEIASGKARNSSGTSAVDRTQRSVPIWITLVQLGFVVWTVSVAHFPALFVGGFLFFLAFAQATAHHQKRLDLRGPLLVGFFLAGLVVHGGLQGWWIEPLLTRLQRWPLFLGATLLTAVNDNAAITYLATLVANFPDELKYSVVAGAVTGGGLTVIANAPNPAGQSILQRYFPKGISPLALLFGALAPTVVMGACFMLF